MNKVLSDAALLRTFEDCTLPFEEWRHRAHIKRYNAATNTPETLERGYYETMTVAWLRLVDFTLREYGPTASADEFLEAQEHLLNKKALRFFYSNDQIVSWRAKAEFVEPDLVPFPRSKREQPMFAT